MKEETNFNENTIKMLLNEEKNEIEYNKIKKQGNDEKEVSVFDELSDKKTPYSTLEEKERKRLIIEELRKTLKAEEFFIIERRFGLETGEKQTHQEISKIVNNSYEWVRINDKKILKKLKQRIENNKTIKDLMLMF